jgi:DNA-binding NtrC family response regulator
MNENKQFPELANAGVLVVDDDETTTELIGAMISTEVVSLQVKRTCAEALAAARTGVFNIALVDIKLPDGDGFDIINQLRAENIQMAIVMITGFVTAETARKIETLGIETLLTKPFSRTQLSFSICRELARGQRRAQGARDTGPATTVTPDDSLVGNSSYIKALRRKIEDFAGNDLPLLILGPTGTGKEVIAQAIHRGSPKGRRPLITVNSSAIPEHLEESEFFGHAKGAFTGATQSKDGIIACADGSTLFLDEVGDLSLRMQAKLLRVLDGHEYMRVGDTAPLKSDFRLISATNRPLADMIKTGAFREDLYFRIKAATLVTMPLTKHKEDIPSLISHFLKPFRARKNRDYSMSVDALEVMMHYTWPGNIRELRNTVEALCAACRDHGDVITKESVLWTLSEAAKNDDAPVVLFSAAKMDFERDYYRTLLIKFNNNISKSSRAAGIERAYFSKRIRALGLAKGKEVKQEVVTLS